MPKKLRVAKLVVIALLNDMGAPVLTRGVTGGICLGHDATGRGAKDDLVDREHFISFSRNLNPIGYWIVVARSRCRHSVCNSWFSGTTHASWARTYD
jgi:hypothetical protein